MRLDTEEVLGQTRHELALKERERILAEFREMEHSDLIIRYARMACVNMRMPELIPYLSAVTLAKEVVRLREELTVQKLRCPPVIKIAKLDWEEFQKRSPKTPLSPEELELLKPPPPAELVGALQDHVYTGESKLISSTHIRKSDTQAKE